MEAQSQTALIDHELEDAQRDFRDTLNRVNQKVERVEARLRPQEIIRNNTVALSLLAGVLGYFAGLDEHPRPLQWVVMGALVGASIAASRLSTSDSDAIQQ
jgi:hypothetical protein